MTPLNNKLLFPPNYGNEVIFIIEGLYNKALLRLKIRGPFRISRIKEGGLYYKDYNPAPLF
jgi:hypothetical protein